jgi:hypothetical protein
MTALVYRLPTPPGEPPYDDEREPDAPQPAPGQTALALSFRLAGGLPAAPDIEYDDTLVAQPTPRAELPDPRPWAARFAQASSEVLAGFRPVGQLLRWTTVAVYDELGAAVGSLRDRPVLRSVRVTEPRDGVAEACALVRTGPRTRALALRLEGYDGRWRCTALEFG